MSDNAMHTRRRILSELLREVPYPAQHEKQILCQTLCYSAPNDLNNELLLLRQRERDFSPLQPNAEPFHTSQSVSQRTPKAISPRAKRLLKQFLQKHANSTHNKHAPRFQWTTIPIQDLRQLAEETKLTRKQLHFQLEYLSRAMGRITPEKRAYLRKYLEEKNHAALQTSDYHHLEEKLGLSRFQLYSMIHYASERRGIVTEAKKRELQHFMEQRSSIHAPLTVDEIRQLNQRLGWSSYQLRFQIKRIRERSTWATMGPGIRDRVETFLAAHPQPSAEQWDQLVNELNLNKDQLRMLKYRLETPYKDVGVDGKEKLRKWLAENGNRRPMNAEVEHLMTETGMGRRQVHSTIATLLDPPQELTQEKKVAIHEWLHVITKAQDCTKTAQANFTKEEFESLRLKVQLGKKQLRNLIQTFQDPRRSFTAEKKSAIYQYLEELNFEKPNAQQLEDLARRVDLSRKQLSEHVRHVLSSPSQCTPEACRRIREWLEQNDYSIPTKASISELMDDTGLNEQQVRYQMSKMRFEWRHKKKSQ